MRVIFFIDSFLERKDCLSNYSDRKFNKNLINLILINKYRSNVSNFKKRDKRWKSQIALIFQSKDYKYNNDIIYNYY